MSNVLFLPIFLFPVYPCEVGYERNADSCYKVTKTKHLRHEAQAVCEEEEANLVTLNDADENRYVRRMLR